MPTLEFKKATSEEGIGKDGILPCFQKVKQDKG